MTDRLMDPRRNWRTWWFRDEHGEEYIAAENVPCTATTTTGRLCRNRVFYGDECGHLPDGEIVFVDLDAKDRAIALLCPLHMRKAIERARSGLARGRR